MKFLVHILKSLAIYMVLFLNCTSAYPQSPAFHWANKIGGLSVDVSQNISEDGLGNTYVTGNFQGTAYFGSTAIVSNGATDMYLAKYNTNGNLVWVRKGGGLEYDFGLDVAVDDNGNCFVTGYYGDGNGSSATFDSITVYGSGNHHMFLAKYDSAGRVQWVQHAGGSETAMGVSIDVDNSGNCYLSGEFTGNALVNGITYSSFGIGDVLVIKYDSMGTILWCSQIGGNYSDHSSGITVDDAGNAYVTGGFRTSAAFGSFVLNTTNAVFSPEIFIVKYDPSGNISWARRAGGPNGSGSEDIAVDGTGSLYLTGAYYGDIDFGGITLSYVDPGNGASDIYLVRYDTNGNSIWVQSAGGVGNEAGLGVNADNSGNVYITGQFTTIPTYPTYFGNFILDSQGSQDVFVARYDNGGNCLWAKQAGGPWNDWGYNLAIDNAGNCYVAGIFGGQTGGSISFDSIQLNSTGSYDGFIAKLGNTLLDAAPALTSTRSLTTFPNPTTSSLTFTYPLLQHTAHLTLTDALGRTVLLQTLPQGTTHHTADLSQLPEAVYFYQLTSESGSLGSGKVAVAR